MHPAAQKTGRRVMPQSLARPRLQLGMSNLREGLKNTIDQIRERQTDHLKLLHAVLQADGRRLFPADLIVTGAVQRSLMVTKGFLSMLRSQNYLCAGALLRLQIDNILRLYAASLFPSGSDTLKAFLEDRPLSRLKAPDGKPLTDKELCTRVGKIYSWVPLVYERTSGFVHFSGVALLSAIQGISTDGTIQFAVGARLGRRWRTAERLEAAQAFDEATKAVLEMVYSWGYTKARAASQRKKRE